MQEYCPDVLTYHNSSIDPLGRSKPEIPMEVIMEATKQEEPLEFDAETDMDIGGNYVESALELLNGMATSLVSALKRANRPRHTNI